MKSMTTLALLGASSLLAGCIIIDDDSPDSYYDSEFGQASNRYGSVFGATVDPAMVSFQVTSNGCTDESYFDVNVVRHSSESYDIAIDRIRSDNCRALVPEGVTVTYSFDELNIPEGASVFVRNPVRRR